MDAETSMRDEEHILEHEEEIKQEIVLSQSELGNQEAVRKAMKKCQNKITHMLKVIKNQKAQNDNLKQQLKNLNENLNNVIAKLNTKNIRTTAQVNKDDVLKKQLDNEIKKNVLLQKEVQQLRVKVKTMDVQRINEMQNQLKQKDRKIQELGQTIKMHEKIQRQDKSTDIYKKQQEFVNKINLLNEEVQHLKGKIAKQKKQEQMTEKMMKKQHQQILNLQSRSKTFDIGSSAKKQKRLTSEEKEAAEKLLYLKQKYNTDGKNQNDKNFKPKPKQISPTEKIKELQQRCETLEVTKKAAEKHFRVQIQILKAKIKSLESELQESKNLLKRKDQQTNILASRMKQTQRKNYNTLQPLQKIKLSHDFASTTAMFDFRKQLKGLTTTQGKHRKFDDSQFLPVENNYRIKSFIFVWFQQHILSLDTIYELKDGAQKQVSSFKIGHEYKNFKYGSLELTEFEYIKEIELYTSKFVEFIRVQTSRDKVLEVGNEKNRTKCKKHTFDISSNQKPIAFLGVLDSKKISNETGREVLVSFGVAIKKKQVAPKARYNAPRTLSLIKSASKSLLDTAKNDKNIIENP